MPARTLDVSTEKKKKVGVFLLELDVITNFCTYSYPSSERLDGVE